MLSMHATLSLYARSVCGTAYDGALSTPQESRGYDILHHNADERRGRISNEKGNHPDRSMFGVLKSVESCGVDVHWR